MAQCPRCKAFVWIQESLKSTRTHHDGPQFSLCCSKGQIILPDLRPVPILLELISGDTAQSADFRSKIRQYNSSLSFTSMGANVDKELANATGGVYTFRINGSVTHLMGSILPPKGRSREAIFSQIYILDPMEQASRRNKIFGQELDEELLLELQQALEDVNPFCREYKSIREREYGKRISQLKIVLKDREIPGGEGGQQRQRRQRQYDLPTTLEVAVLLPGVDVIKERRDIIVETRSSGLKRIYEDHVVYDTLHYVLLHPMGDHGWSYNSYEKRIEGPKPKYVTAREFYAYRLQIRPLSDDDDRCYFWMFGRLCHEYVVDQYAKIEAMRLCYIKKYQDKLRAELYRGVVDAMHNNVPAAEVGRHVVLPSSFTGGPRQMHQLFQDSMAIVRHFGRPDLFITFTCNPNWPEIRNEIDRQRLPGQIPNDRPDLIVRLFKIKLEALLDDLLEKHVLGKVVAYTYVIEFQKRGLPHAHILLILDEEDKPRTPEDFDKIVSAEIPDPNTCPNLYKTVISSMIHGPCGRYNQKSPCMKDGKCSKKYPRPFSNETTQNEDGYPTYRRRESDPHIIERNGKAYSVDNRWVVPYNPYLATKYDAHINVEVCASITAVKYLYKYVYKGHDRTRMAVTGQDDSQQTEQELLHRDEIKEYLDARYISACESLWRIFEFTLYDHSQTVVRLQVHLEGEHRVTFQEIDDLQDVAEENHTSQLLGWFELNERDESARQFTYPDIPKHYTWHRDKARPPYWKKRKIKKEHDVISRMYFVNPKERERYCLRLLLLHVKGARGFQDLRTMDGHVFGTFRDSAVALGLMEDDSEWTECLREAALFHLPPSLRQLFAMILIHCSPSEPLLLWNQFAVDFSEDYLFRLRLERQGRTQQLHSDMNEDDDHLHPYTSEDGGNIHPYMSEDDDQDLIERAKKRALSDIDRILRGVGSSLSAFPELPQDVEDLVDDRQMSENVDLLAEQARQAQINVDMFNADQFSAFSVIKEALYDEDFDNRLFFVDGPGGTGKSFLFNTLIDYVQGLLRKKIIVVASTGIAALILKGGNTAHSTFMIPLKCNAESTCNISLRTNLANWIFEADVIVWDEAPMQHRHDFEAVDRTIRDITKVDRMFGGKVVIFGGDFRQILPVVRRGSEAEIEGACLKKSEIWGHVRVLKLTENMRISRGLGDPATQEFIDYLLRVGNGTEPTVAIGAHDDCVRIPSYCIFKVSNTTRNNSPEKQLIRAIYEGLETHGPSPKFLAERAILTPLNADVDRLNSLATDMLHGSQTTTYLSQDSIPDEGAAATFSPEYLSTLNPSGMPPSRLELKIGQPIVLLRNLNPARGMCNGTRFIVRALGVRCIQAEIMTGPFRGNLEFLFRTPLDTLDDEYLSFKFRRCQFPVKPAFAMTIHKAQGQTLNHVGLYLPQPVFSHGQLYVALSRCSNPKNLRVLIEDGANEGTPGSCTRNVVFHSVLRDV